MMGPGLAALGIHIDRITQQMLARAWRVIVPSLKPDPTLDQSAAYQAAIDRAVAAGGGVILSPPGRFMIQDPTSGSHPSSTDGPIRIPPGARGIHLRGTLGSTLVLGPNGVSTAMVRVFGGACSVSGLEFDFNSAVVQNTKDNCGIQINANAGTSVAGVDASDCLVEGNYLHSSRIAPSEYSTGTIEYDHAGHAQGSRIVILTGGTWPATVATNGRIQINGVRYDIGSRIDGTFLQLPSGSNPGGDVASGTSYQVKWEPLKNGGRDGIQVLGGFRNRIVYNTLLDIGWSAIRCSGGDNEANFNNVKDQRGNGIRVLEHTGSFTAKGNVVESAHCSGRACIIADAGSADDGDGTPQNPLSNALTNNDKRVERLVLRDNTCRITTDGFMEGAGSALKIAAVRSCLVDGGEYNAGIQTNNLAVRLEDAITKIEFTGDYRIVGEFNQAPVFRGTVTAETSSATATYTAKSQLTIASHGLVTGKSLYITNSQIARLNNREFIVLEVVSANAVIIGEITNEGGTVVAVPYTGGTITNTQAHAGTHELIMRGGIVQRGKHNTNYMIRGIFAPWCSIERVKLEMLEAKTALVKEAAINTSYSSDLGMQMLRIVNNEFLFNSDKLCKCIRGDGDNTDGAASTILLTAGKQICYGNRMANRNTGAVHLVNIYETNDSTASYDDRLVIFSTVGEDPNTFWASAVPAEGVVTWNDGDEVRNSAPAAAGTPGWVVTTPGKPGTFKARAVLAS